jgi:hypothetical protein
MKIFYLFEEGCGRWVKVIGPTTLQFHPSKENASQFKNMKQAMDCIQAYPELKYYWNKETLCIQSTELNPL